MDITTQKLLQFGAFLRTKIQRVLLASSSSLWPDTEFNSLALELFALQYALNEPFRKLCASLGRRPETVEHWTRIPSVPPRAFKELEISCLAKQHRSTVFHSSGTTAQQPSRHFHSPNSLALYRDSLWTWFCLQINRDAPTADLILLAPPLSEAPHSSLVHMFEEIRLRRGVAESAFCARTGPDGTWMLDGAKVLARLQESAEGNVPVVVLGTAFLFVHLLEEMERQNLTLALPRGSLVMETGGYKGRSRELSRESFYSFMRGRLGLSDSSIFAEYGMSELSSQGYDGGGAVEQRVFQFPPWARVRVISPETGVEVAPGECGLICIHDLANAFSVAGVLTEDLGIRRSAGFSLRGRIAKAEPRGCSLMAAR